MSHEKRLKFLSEGLPIIHESAEGYWKASLELDESPREAEVLRGYAEEEAAKVLILMDSVRCPKKLVSGYMGKIVGWFYNHLARLIYAEAIGWRPTHVDELRKYVESVRKSHSVEGAVGEFIMPNLSLYMRESQLYVDVVCEDERDPYWNEPLSTGMGTSFEPLIVKLTRAMSVLGLFSLKGLNAISETWGQMTFSSVEGPVEALHFTRQLVNRLILEEVATETASEEDVKTLINLWQLPMYDFDFGLIEVPLDELKDEQERVLFSEFGLPEGDADVGWP